MSFGGPKVPGSLGYAIFFKFSRMDKQIQFSQMIILVTNPQNIATNMVWGDQGSKDIWDIQFSLYFL